MPRTRIRMEDKANLVATWIAISMLALGGIWLGNKIDVVQTEVVKIRQTSTQEEIIDYLSQIHAQLCALQGENCSLAKPDITKPWIINPEKLR